MTTPLATFKYDHGDKNPWSWVNWVSALAIVAVAIAGFSVVPPLGIVSLILLTLLWARWLPKRQIRLGIRYAIVGNTIVYFRNVRKMELRDGHLTLHWGKDQVLQIERSRFPTNARKDEKIAKNKAAKFEKVCERIIRRVLQAAPGVQLAGIDREAHLAAAARPGGKGADYGKAGP